MSRKATITLATYEEYSETIAEVIEKIQKIEDKSTRDAFFSLLNLFKNHTHPYKKPTVYR